MIEKTKKDNNLPNPTGQNKGGQKESNHQSRHPTAKKFNKQATLAGQTHHQTTKPTTQTKNKKYIGTLLSSQTTQTTTTNPHTRKPENNGIVFNHHNQTNHLHTLGRHRSSRRLVLIYTPQHTYTNTQVKALKGWWNRSCAFPHKEEGAWWYSNNHYDDLPWTQ